METSRDGDSSPDPGSGGAAIAVPAAVLRPKLIAFLLVVSIFGEIVTIGGIAIGRVAVPLGLIAATSQFLGTPTKLRDSGLTVSVVIGYALLALASLSWSVSPSHTLTTLASLALALTTAAAFAILIRQPRALRRVRAVVRHRQDTDNRTCNGDPFLAFLTATFVTNGRQRRGAARVHAPEDAEGLHGLTLRAMWTVVIDGVVVCRHGLPGGHPGPTARSGPTPTFGSGRTRSSPGKC